MSEKRNQVRGSALIDVWAGVSANEKQQRDMDAEIPLASAPTSFPPLEMPEAGGDDVVEMDQAKAHSSCLANARAVDSELCVKMVEAWRACKFLS